MHKIKEMLMEELKKYEGKQISGGSLDIMHKLTDTIKNIDKIEMLESEQGYSQARGGYSRGGEWEARGDYGRGNSYDDGGNSYARGRGRNARRDDMGRYSREGAKDEVMEKLEEMMEISQDDRERETIKRCMSQLKMM